MLFLAAAAAAWAGGVQLRPYTLQTHCISNPQGCTSERVPAFDQFAIGKEDRDADSRSFDTQRWAGSLAILGIWAWLIVCIFVSRLNVFSALKLAAIDLVLLLQSYVANGALNEAVKTFVERPRPFVYSDPGRHGLDPAHYTSFYSGHASFAAVSAVALVLALRRRGAPIPLYLLAGVLGGSLAVATAYYRVASGRHFPSDVFAGLIFGTACAIAVAWVHAHCGRDAVKLASGECAKVRF